MAERLDADTERRMVAGAQRGDDAAMERLLAANRPLLVVLSRRMGAPNSMTDELVQAGFIGLIQAVRRFQPGQGARLTTYALPWILGEMRRALRCALDATGARDKRRELTRCEASLRETLGRAPRMEEVAQACGMDARQAAQIDACARQSVSLEAFGDSALPGGLEIDVDRVSLRVALETLCEDERCLIYLRYFRDRTQQETARLLQKSQAQVSKLERRALDRLRALLA